MKQDIRTFFFNLPKLLSSDLSAFVYALSDREIASSSKGFTMIELLVVFSILSIIAAVGLVSFSSYGAIQQLNLATLDVRSTIEYAKSQAISQVDTCSGTKNQFLGYTFQACCSTGCSSSCISSGTGDRYEIDEECSDGTTTTPLLITAKNLPKNISFATGGAYTYFFTFNPLSGSLSGSGGVIVVQEGPATKNITVSSSGIVQ